MDIKERNKQIKKALGREFGYRNVSVRGGRGTAYGWVHVKIRIPKPHEGECGLYCDDCAKAKEDAERKVWEILEKTGLYDELGTWYDDMGYKHKEITLDIELDESMAKQEREKEEIDGDGYKVIYEGSWTWIKFEQKPAEEVRAKLKEMGFRFSRKRLAWYMPKKVEVSV